MTHTYVLLDLSRFVYGEIASRLRVAGYQDAFHEDGVIDMHGLAVRPTNDPIVPETRSKRVQCRIACRKHSGKQPWCWLGLQEPLEFEDRAVADRMRYEFSMQDDTRLYMTVEVEPDSTFKEPEL